MQDYRENLKKLADYLWKLPANYEQFGMEHFMESKRGFETVAKLLSCGCVACAIGHGPSAGVPAGSKEGWRTYAERVFDICFVDDEWEWLFAAEWVRVDNTAKGAAQRIYYYLQHGLPSDWREQVAGTAPLCYLDQGAYTDEE